MSFATAVRDDAELLRSALNIAKDRVRLIITTGGLGPTENDLTREIVSDLFNMPLIPSGESYTNKPQCADTLHEGTKKIKSIPPAPLSFPMITERRQALQLTIMRQISYASPAYLEKCDKCLTPI
ncbi:MAG: hypothetical protein HS127_14355 [Planctomycetia bacterium]|nr:hypothetical protein [Planctomycetia bacterium]